MVAKMHSVAVVALLLLQTAVYAQDNAGGPPRNPFLAADKYAITHFDSSQSDSFPYDVPRGMFRVDLRKEPRIVRGPVNIMTLASTSPNYMWAASSEGLTYVDVSNNGFREVARITAPGQKTIPNELQDKILAQRFTSAEQVQKLVSDDYGLNWTRAVNGVYAVVDKDNHVFYNTADGSVSVFGLVDESNPAAGIKLIRTVDMKPTIGRNLLVGTGITYDGKFVVASNQTISVFDRSLEGEPQTVHFGEDEHVTNSFAIDEHNGIYIASDKYMHKLVWTGTRLSEDEADGAWKAPYDSGRQPPTVKIGTGTGSTPTLMGFGDAPDKLVVITDGADHMKLVAFWRDQLPAGWKTLPDAKSERIAGQVHVTAGLNPLPEFVQSEQSVVVNGYGAFVVNNIARSGEKDKLVDVLALGPVNQPGSGCQRFEWDPQVHRWHSVWARGDVVSTSMVPSVSAASGIVFVNGYYKKTGWEVTGLDWKTGKTVQRVSFGHDNLGNGAYAIIQFAPNGDLIFNSVGGPVRAALRNEAGS
ncbi:MAG: hypothetical protein AB1704_12985 [Pseudomonadota bacterium]|uniref:hypothetical protein n=1 Tax=Burkholderiaceae TaxID=119060 RepID=UPI0010F5D104|nr:hypothetical protein [Burkholderia sp. 4M9327F10]